MAQSTIFVFFLLLITVQTAVKVRTTDELSLECKRDVTRIFWSDGNDPSVSRAWRRMVEATGFPDTNVQRAVQMWPGSYESCLTTDVSRYCIAAFHMTLTRIQRRGPRQEAISVNLPVSAGLCVPMSCSEGDVSMVLRTLSSLPSHRGLVESGLALSLKELSSRCYARPEEFVYPRKFLICSAFVVTLVVGVLIATLMDRSRPSHEQSFSANLFNSFSLKSNASHLFSLNDDPKSIQFVDCLRIVSLATIIGGHTILYGTYKASNALEFFASHSETLFESLFSTVDLHTDTFFVISSLLMTITQLKSKQEQSFLGRIGSIVRRFVRLTPLYAFVIWVRVAMLDDVTSNPIWTNTAKAIVTEADDCATGFVANLLYFNNLNYDPNSFCLIHTWFLANEMQFYVLGLLLLIPLIKNQALFLRTTKFFIVASIAITFVISYLSEAHHWLKSDPIATYVERRATYYSSIYIQPYARFGAYGIGILLGIAINDAKPLLKSQKSVNYLAITSALGLPIVPASVAYFTTLDPFRMSAFTSLFRIVWAVGVSVVIYQAYIAQISGKAGRGFIARVALSRYWLPLSKLSYSVYLANPIFINFFYNSHPETFELNLSFKLLCFFLYFMVISFLLGFFLYLFIERPAYRLWILVEKKTLSLCRGQWDRKIN